MGLQPLEFTDGLTDSPLFRKTLHEHEGELEKTSLAIKHLIKDVKELIAAARHLSRAQRTLSETLNDFNFECIGSSLTDDELIIANSFKDFARLLTTIEDERDRLLEKADEAFLEPIEKFRREQIGSAKAAKKSFEKETAKYYSFLERYLATSVKKGEVYIQESDASYSIEQWHYYDAMSKYVLKLQEVSERKKFEFVETVLSFMLGWMTFYHQGHEIATDFYSVKIELQMRLQRTRNNFNLTQAETRTLRQKMLNNKERFLQNSTKNGLAREGYLFMMEKKAFSTAWNRYFVKYEKAAGRLVLMTYAPTSGKLLSEETFYIKEVIRRPSETIDRRFCFDVIYWLEPPPLVNGSARINGTGVHSGHLNGRFENVAGPSNSFANISSTLRGSNGASTSTLRPGDVNYGASGSNSTYNNAGGGNSITNVASGSNAITNGDSNSSNMACNVHTLQALDEEDYKCWLEILEAREPTPSELMNASGKSAKSSNKDAKSKSEKKAEENAPPPEPTYELDDEGFCFSRMCIEAVEKRGLDPRGIYRVNGVASKVKALLEEYSKHRLASKSAGIAVAARAEGKTEEEVVAMNLLPDLDLDREDLEAKTITSALKNYLRNLAEPIMTFHLYMSFVESAKLDNLPLRIERIHYLVHLLPPTNFRLMKMLLEHLTKVTSNSEENCMNPSNLGVCFGPTLLRPPKESVAAIIDIKFVNVIAELLIENYELFFSTKPKTHVFEQNQSNNQQLSSMESISSGGANPIQQRPLPHVPAHQIQNQPTGMPNGNRFVTKASVHRKPQLNAHQYQQRANVPRLQLVQSGPLLRTAPGIPGSPNDVRSFSQDQLYSSLIPPMRTSQLSVVPGQISPGSQYHQQTLVPPPSIQQSQYLNMQEVQKQMQAKQQQQQTANYNRSISQHVTSSSLGALSQSPGSSSPASTPGYLGQQHSLPPQQLIYQAPMLLKQQQHATMSKRSLSSQMQPSASFQNLHYSSALGLDQPDMRMLNSQMSTLNIGTISNYARPLTSLAALAPNSVTGAATNRSPLVVPANRNFNLSSSNSMPTSPETISTGLQPQQSMFTYQGQQAFLKSRYIPSGSTLLPGASPPGSSTSVEPQASPSDGYNTITNSSIYGTIGALPPIDPEHPERNQGRIVRTKYVCIASTPGELSFQPNQIVTNVRETAEAGWLEGSLNGSVGLIPYNYVEFLNDPQ